MSQPPSVAACVADLLVAETVAAATRRGSSPAKVFADTELLGYHAGASLAHRLAARRPPPQAPVDAVKFVCRDVWGACFARHVDTLRTNHHGVFVLVDRRARSLHACSPPHPAARSSTSTSQLPLLCHLAFPAGLIRGALAALGIPATVSPDVAAALSARVNLLSQSQSSNANPSDFTYDAATFHVRVLTSSLPQSSSSSLSVPQQHNQSVIAPNITSTTTTTATTTATVPNTVP